MDACWHYFCTVQHKRFAVCRLCVLKILKKPTFDPSVIGETKGYKSGQKMALRTPYVASQRHESTLLHKCVLNGFLTADRTCTTKYFCIYSPNFLSFWANLEGIPLGTPLARRGASKRHPSCNSARTRLVMQSTWFENKAPSARASHCLPKVLLSRVSWLHGWLCAGWLLATMVFWPEMQVKSV